MIGTSLALVGAMVPYVGQRCTYRISPAHNVIYFADEPSRLGRPSLSLSPPPEPLPVDTTPRRSTTTASDKGSGSRRLSVGDSLLDNSVHQGGGYEVPIDSIVDTNANIQTCYKIAFLRRSKSAGRTVKMSLCVSMVRKRRSIAA